MYKSHWIFQNSFLKPEFHVPLVFGKDKMLKRRKLRRYKKIVEGNFYAYARCIRLYVKALDVDSTKRTARCGVRSVTGRPLCDLTFSIF